ncbi:hypothetical protein QTG56_25195 (plasmid) [Rossellomorea sp. AcN35-11]|nr:hypothetical protein [Rossellomorea aquimaris]WJV31931.1 hypothetical protein QTG56_25195 [Rossellomorea sp. AcN35-11]
MTNNVTSGKRVTKLWKDERWQQNMKTAGIASSIAEMNFQLKLDEETKGTYNRLRNAVKSRISKNLAQLNNIEELMEFTNEITGYRSIIEISELDSNPANKEDDYWIQLLFACAREKASKEKIQNQVPLQVKLIDRYGSKDVGLTFLKQKINAKLHDTRRRLSGSYKVRPIFDLTLLMADLMIENALVEFTKTNMKNLRFAYVKDYVNRNTKEVLNHSGELKEKVLFLPEDKEYKAELLKFMKDNHLYPQGLTGENERKYYNKEEKLFNLEKQEDFQWIVTDTWFKDVVTYEFLTQMFRVRDKTKKEIEQAKQYEIARSFETKKNIPQLHLDKMKNNAFLSRYSYVEIDELLEIPEFEKLEEEFRKLQKLTFVPYSDGSFRIRRLGRQKAAGIYYSHVNATVIDNPSSYIHELHHQIDYTTSKDGLLSESIAFRPVFEAYKKSVNEAVEVLPDTDLFKSQWNGTSKYNKNYYLDPAEVFARSAEIYLSEVKQIETSFLKTSYKDKPEYPLSQEFLEVVEEYFGRLYNSFYTEGRKEEKKKEQVASASPSEVVSTKTVSEEVNSEQLSLF